MRRRIPISIAVVLLLSCPRLTFAATRAELQDAMRRLWGDHVAYTRLYIVSAAAGSADADATAQRLLQNQTDIGNAVAAYYGREAGDKLTALLKDHILIAASIVKAAKAGDTSTVNSENKRWHDNAADLARLLHGANPDQWPEATLLSALNTHLDQTIKEATDQLQNNYAASMKDYDEAMDHMLMLADTLTNGIVAQFPSKFSHVGAAKQK